MSLRQSLPLLMIPCPGCLGRMAFQSVSPSDRNRFEAVYGCQECGAELVRTEYCPVEDEAA